MSYEIIRDKKYVLSSADVGENKCITGESVSANLLRYSSLIKKICNLGKRLVIPVDCYTEQEPYNITESLKDINADTEYLYLLLGHPVVDDSVEAMYYINLENEGDGTITVIGNAVLVTCDAIASNVDSIIKCINGGELMTLEAIDKAVDDKRREDIKRLLLSGKTKRIELIRKNCDELSEQIKTVKKTLIASARQLECREMELLSLNDKLYTDEKVINDTIEALASSNKLLEFKVSGDNAVFYTDYLSIKDENGYVHPLGKYEITVGMNDSSVVFINLDNKIDIDEWNKHNDTSVPHHPHTSPTGIPCLGNVAEPLADACAAYDIVSVWQLCLSYLESYNDNDVWGKRLRYWACEDGELVKSVVKGRANVSEVVCSSCGCVLDEEEDYIPECDICGAILCEGCVFYSDSDGVYLCESHAVYCDRCEGYHPSDGYVMHECAYCGESFCEERTDYYIGDSGDYYCSIACALDNDDLREEDREDEEDA